MDDALLEARSAAAVSDIQIRELALQFAPRMRADCTAALGGVTPDDTDIAVGLIVRAAAAAIVRYGQDIMEVAALTEMYQSALAQGVNELLVDGRRPGPAGSLN